MKVVYRTTDGKTVKVEALKIEDRDGKVAVLLPAETADEYDTWIELGDNDARILVIS